MQDSNGLFRAYFFDSSGKGSTVGWPELRKWQADQGLLWVDLDRLAPQTRSWLENESGLDPIICEALLTEETRPRSLTTGDNLLVILRGVNLNPGADPEDMVSVRLWTDGHRVITVRSQRMLAIEDISEQLAAGDGPTSIGEFVAALAGRLVERMRPVVDSIQDELDALEEDLLEGKNKEVRSKLSGLRRMSVILRRYLAPQRDVISRLSLDSPRWCADLHKAQLRESADRITRYVEDLDASRERAAVTQEELIARTQDRMNQNMYVLSLVAAIFLPLGFVTGLLGINVGGIPGTESPLGFLVVCLIMGVIVAVELVLLFVRKWF
ncbi:MAG: zinc transporter ZntB [Candidatus Delongbacteria bacterium]|nr:zinc transporter ZntB [Candidatus Delongbacteria bacterium]